MNQREKLLQKAECFGLRDLPIGAYVTDPGGKMIAANRYARELFQLPPEGELEASVTDFYPPPMVREKLSQASGDAGARAANLPPAVSVTIAGREVHLRDYSRPVLDDETREVIGFLICVEDVTREYSLRHKVEELTYDIGQMLHTYSSTLLMTKLMAGSIMRGLEPDPFGGEHFVSPDAAVAALAVPAQACASAARRMLERARDGQPASQSLPEERQQDLRRVAELLGDYRRVIPYAEIIPTVLQEAAVMLLEIRQEIKPGLLPPELIAEVESHARELVRMCSLITLHRLTDAAIEMEHTVRSLREFILSGDRVEPPRTVQGAPALVARAVENVKDFARASGVQLKRKAEEGGAYVEVNERDVVRALVNILHNAIKYSWSRGGVGNDTWVRVHTYVEGGRLCFRVENYGVPIPEDEIEQGLIFKIGFRGRMSGDRGRVGSGIGLADALRVARAHGGDITVESHPAAARSRADDYTQPFVTTVTFSLPIHGREDDEA